MKMKSIQTHHRGLKISFVCLWSFVFKGEHLADSFGVLYSNCNSMTSSKPIKHLIKDQNNKLQSAEVMNNLLIFHLEFLLNPFSSALNSMARSRFQNEPRRYLCGPTYHDYTTTFPLLILTEHMSQDTYSLSYGNVIPDTMLSCSLLGLLYHIMIPRTLPWYGIYPPI